MPDFTDSGARTGEAGEGHAAPPESNPPSPTTAGAQGKDEACSDAHGTDAVRREAMSHTHAASTGTALQRLGTIRGVLCLVVLLALTGCSGSQSGNPGAQQSPSPLPEPSPTRSLEPSPITGMTARQLLSECGLGTLAFHQPQGVTEGRHFTLSVAVTPPGSTANPSAALPPAPGPVITKYPQLCELVTPVLTSYPIGDFTITPAPGQSNPQLLSADRATPWSWDVLPLTHGPAELILNLYTSIANVPVFIEPTTYQINVAVAPVYEFSNFIKDWAAPLGIGVPSVVAAAGALWLWIKKQRKTRQRPQKQQKAHQRK
ncbi:hypothetical protein [Arthrobacter dokdonensis]|uniref:hypothetical protein n=1 Tax=Arthrobacter dokdonellae TaxID=2211210 RepID=UPI001013CDC0|nr:hypothetical protein [Arthrobacter dokdonellae]